MSTETLMQFLSEGDLLGFLQAIYVTAFTNPDVLYGFVTMVFLVPIYLRTHSLALLSILWILVGTSFMVAMPLISSLGLILLIMGIAGLFWQLLQTRSTTY